MSAPRCAHCGTSVPVGQRRVIEVHRSSGAAPDLIVHDRPEQCAPTVPVRRSI